MFNWPNLELTDYERKFVRIYKTKDKVGVLRRTYKVVLNDPAQPDSNLPVIATRGQIQISRRSRVFALTFSGNTDSWRLGISNASGTQYTAKMPRSGKDSMVSAMVPGSTQNASSLGGLAPPLSALSISDGEGPAFQANSANLQTVQPFPLIIEPNWLLMPNETIIFEGTPVHVTYANGKTVVTPKLTLTVVMHVWEFPVMGTAAPAVRENV